MRVGSGPKDYGVVALLDQDLRAFEAVFLRKTDGLAAAVLEDFSGHIYTCIYVGLAVKLRALC